MWRGLCFSVFSFLLFHKGFSGRRSYLINLDGVCWEALVGQLTNKSSVVLHCKKTVQLNKLQNDARNL